MHTLRRVWAGDPFGFNVADVGRHPGDTVTHASAYKLERWHGGASD